MLFCHLSANVRIFFWWEKNNQTSCLDEVSINKRHSEGVVVDRRLKVQMGYLSNVGDDHMHMPLCGWIVHFTEEGKSSLLQHVPLANTAIIHRFSTNCIGWEWWILLLEKEMKWFDEADWKNLVSRPHLVTALLKNFLLFVMLEHRTFEGRNCPVYPDEFPSNRYERFIGEGKEGGMSRRIEFLLTLTFSCVQIILIILKIYGKTTFNFLSWTDFMTSIANSKIFAMCDSPHVGHFSRTVKELRVRC